jgi:dTDP-glucose 4,6-dehydratase
VAGGGRSGARRRVGVPGGAGFLGSHLCELLLGRGDEVVCLDDFSTGRRENVAALEGRPGFEVRQVDVSEGLDVEGRIDAVAHLACPASPPHYLARPLETLQVCSEGTRHALGLAHDAGARFVLASTSEVYGDPEEHPQREAYWGHVNPVGPRSVYDEGKRYAEALAMAWRRTKGTDVGIVRIFNTYGPRLRPDDGRVVSNFLVQALAGEPLTVYGDGTQTRSLCYVDDLVEGIARMLDADHAGPVNLGNPDEYSMLELARVVLELTGSSSELRHLPLPVDDPTRRRPDIALAAEVLGWGPTTPLAEGLRRTAAYLTRQAGGPA